MKTSKFSIAGYLAGAVMIFMAAKQYYFLYPDIDKLFFYAMGGLVAIGMSFNYNKGRMAPKHCEEEREKSKKELNEKITILEGKVTHVDNVMQEIMEK